MNTNEDEARDLLYDGVCAIAKMMDAKDARIAKLEEALEWCAGHSYAGGRCFGDVQLVREAIGENVWATLKRQARGVE